jgi:hypothetical protein
MRYFRNTIAVVFLLVVGFWFGVNYNDKESNSLGVERDVLFENNTDIFEFGLSMFDRESIDINKMRSILGDYYTDGRSLYFYREFKESGANKAVQMNIVGMDFETLAHIESDSQNIFFKDKDSVYILDPISPKVILVVGVDPGTFEISEDICSSGEGNLSFYARDENNIFCGSSVIGGADIGTFTYIGLYSYGDGMPWANGIAKDKNCVYMMSDRVTNAGGGPCFSPVDCDTESLKNDPTTCGLFDHLNQ